MFLFELMSHMRVLVVALHTRSAQLQLMSTTTTTTTPLGEELACARHLLANTFDLLYHVCSASDVSDQLVSQLFEFIFKDDDDDVSSSQWMPEESSRLLARLAAHLPPLHSTSYLRMPYQAQHEPVDYLLDTASSAAANSLKKRWSVHLDQTTPPTTTTSTSPAAAAAASTLTQSNNRMIKESAQELCCIRLPLSKSPLLANYSSYSTSRSRDDVVVHHSYSIEFMLRLDTSVLDFCKSYGLVPSQKRTNTTSSSSSSSSANDNNKHAGGSKTSGSSASSSSSSSSFDSYVHLVSFNLTSEQSAFELWLNPSGHLLFM